MNRYYSFDQFWTMKNYDPNARMRNPVLENSPDTYVCVFCGSTDRFFVKGEYRSTVKTDPGGMLIKSGEVIKIKHLINDIYNTGGNPVVECARCGGPAIELKIIREDCSERGCLGCLLCGRVAPVERVLQEIERCPVCFGGDKKCHAECPRAFMRFFHGIDRRYFKKAEADNDGRRFDISGRERGLDALFAVLPEVR